MSKLPAMPVFVDAYLADTSHLTLEEHGAYLLLLFAMWRRNGSIPDSDADNARILGLSLRAWHRLKPRLSPFLETIGGNLTQKRLQHEWNRAQDNRAKQREKGAAGAKERWQRKHILESGPRHSTGNGKSNAPEIGIGSGTGYDREIAPIPNKNNTSTCTVAEGAEVSKLLKTRLMARSA